MHDSSYHVLFSSTSESDISQPDISPSTFREKSEKNSNKKALKLEYDYLRKNFYLLQGRTEMCIYFYKKK